MPFDNIKTRLQSASTGNDKGMITYAGRMLREEGLRVFWRGTTPRLVRLMVGQYFRKVVIRMILLICR